MNDAQERLDELRRLTAAKRAAVAAEAKAATLHREARARRREAELAVSRWLAADAEPCPLFDGLGVMQEVAIATSGVARPDVTPEVTSEAADDGGALEEVPSREGRRKLADLTVRGQRCQLWLWPDGRHHILFDCERFGNWDRNDLKGPDYWPTAEEVASSASVATNYFLSPADWGPLHGRLWQLELACDPKDHPEPWRLSKLEWMPNRWAAPLRKAGLETFGALMARMEFWHAWQPGGYARGLESIKGAPRKPLPPFASPEAELVALVRSEWETGTEAGRRGEFPDWLPAPKKESAECQS